MMTLKPMSDAQTHLLYANQMRRDFPPNELKTLSAILKMKHEGTYDVIGAYVDDVFAGYALCYHPKDERIVLLDYLAVEADMRGRGIGTMLLDALRAYYADGADTMMIECERPKSAPDEQMARKRIRFYTQAGAQLTNVRIWLFEVEYSILVLPCGQETVVRDWAQQMLSMYRQMLTPSVYTRYVRLIRG